MTLPFPHERALADRAFAEATPRRCTPEWLDRVSGAARFPWDVDAMQVGYVDLLYGVFDAYPQRYRPILTARLLGAASVDPAGHLAVLAATELLFVAALTLQPYKNGRDIREANVAGQPAPLPVMATVAFTAGQYAASLVASHAVDLKGEARAWLAYRTSRALYQTCAGKAVDVWCAEKGRPVDTAVLAENLRLSVAPVAFRLSVDCALAVLGRTDEGTPLQEAAGLAGAAYQVAMEVLRRRRPGPPEDLTLDWAGGELLPLARELRARAAGELGRAPDPLRSALAEFVEQVVDPRIELAREAADGR